jgi:hypothetical protein
MKTTLTPRQPRHTLAGLIAAASLLASGAALAHPGHDSPGLIAWLAHALFAWHGGLGVLTMTGLVAVAGIALIGYRRKPAAPAQRPDAP